MTSLVEAPYHGELGLSTSVGRPRRGLPMRVAGKRVVERLVMLVVVRSSISEFPSDCFSIGSQTTRVHPKGKLSRRDHIQCVIGGSGPSQPTFPNFLGENATVDARFFNESRRRLTIC